jgi:N-acetylglucosaminyldiphosphoundecaprenol N-acetyl-beta-D-mannosaminyltransferase
MLAVMKATTQKSEHSHFLLGGQQSTLDKLSLRFSENEIAGVYSPPFGEWADDENEKIRNLIRESGAKYVWVGLGCPKQETWIAKHLDSLPSAVYFGIGAAFAFHAGEVKQAPAFIQKSGMEWLFRLCAEPRRLFKRYAVHNSLFLYYTLKDHVSG